MPPMDITEVLAFGFTALLLTLCGIGCRSENDAKTVTVVLGGNIERCEGFNWHDRKAKSSIDHVSIERPSTVTIAHNGKKLCTSFSKLTIVKVKNNVVREVTLLPLKGSAKYREVIDVLRSFCEKMEIVFDEKAANRLQALERKQPTNDPFSTVTFAHVLDNSVKLFVEIKPVISENGWFASISLVDLTLFKEAPPSSAE